MVLFFAVRCFLSKFASPHAFLRGGDRVHEPSSVVVILHCVRGPPPCPLLPFFTHAHPGAGTRTGPCSAAKSRKTRHCCAVTMEAFLSSESSRQEEGSRARSKISITSVTDSRSRRGVLSVSASENSTLRFACATN